MTDFAYNTKSRVSTFEKIATPIPVEF